MSNAVYPVGLDAFGEGQINWPADTIMVQLVGAGFPYSASDTNPTQIGDTIGDAAIMATNKYVMGGAFHCDAVVLPAVPSGATVKAMVIYQDNGVLADSPLIAFIDTRSDSAPIDLATDGSDITLSWASGIVFKI